MIPVNLNASTIIEIDNTVKQPSLTYRVVDGEIVVGKIDELDAIKQAIVVALSVERYEHPIYSWSFGAELSDLIGKDVAYVCPTAAKRIKECLLADDRILDVDSWSFSKSGNSVMVNFTVHTIYGDMNMRKEVII